jgi:hypothetical protein
LPECCFEPVGKAGWPLISRHMIARWKGMIEEIHFGVSIMPSAIIEKLNLEKTSFGPGSLNLLKLVNCQNCQKVVLGKLGKLGGHRYPPILIRDMESFFGM